MAWRKQFNPFHRRNGRQAVALDGSSILARSAEPHPPFFALPKLPRRSYRRLTRKRPSRRLEPSQCLHSLSGLLRDIAVRHEDRITTLRPVRPSDLAYSEQISWYEALN
jgi:hypothetical protein